ncbi:MAG TPA: cytochrome c1 [Gammaproteobacteria bacterium]|nr:cytochrome c1 [Gammaproteobacteria bacterium]
MKYAAALIALTCIMSAAVVQAQEAQVSLKSPHYSFDRQTLIRGAKLFVDRCLTCHTLKYLRYSRVGEDLGLSKAQVKNMLMAPANAEYHAGMINTMRPGDATKWLGAAPPDLTLEARYRGTDWIYTYLKSFYVDSSRPSGWNNHVFPHVAMPDVLAMLGGERDRQGKLIKQGSLNQEQFDQVVADLTAWLQYTSDPSKIQRMSLGPWVIGFLVTLSILTYLLKRVYWRAVH